MNKTTFAVLIGFLLLFAGYSTTHQIVVVLLGTQNLAATANYALGSTYMSFFFGNLIAPTMIRRLGPRLALVTGAIPYAFFPITAAIRIPSLIVISGILVGLGGSMVWNASTELIRHNSPGNRFGEFIGYKNASVHVGGSITLLCMSRFLQGYNPTSFIILGGLSTIGILLFLLCSDHEVPDGVATHTESKPISLSSSRAPSPMWRLAPLAFVGAWCLAMKSSALQLLSERYFGLSNASSLAITIALCSLASALTFGKIADKIGGKNSTVIVATGVALGSLIIPFETSLSLFLLYSGILTYCAVGLGVSLLVYIKEQLPDEPQLQASSFFYSCGAVGTTIGFFAASQFNPSTLVVAAAPIAAFGLAVFLTSRKLQ